jgi:hypothetical protein
LLDRELCNFKCNKTVCTKFVFKKPHPSKLFAAQRGPGAIPLSREIRERMTK